MKAIRHIRNVFSALLASGFLAYGGAALAQTAAPAVPRIRATIEKITGNKIEVVAKGGKKMTLTLAPDAGIFGVTQGTTADIKSDSFIGTAAVAQADGTLKALEVTVFPSGMKAGEGHYPWDLGRNSTMTNGTVSKLVVSRGRILTVTYPNGEKKIVVPNDVPIVNLEKGDRSLLISGAHAVFFMSKLADGAQVAAHVSVGRNGLVPPM